MEKKHIIPIDASDIADNVVEKRRLKYRKNGSPERFLSLSS